MRNWTVLFRDNGTGSDKVKLKANNINYYSEGGINVIELQDEDDNAIASFPVDTVKGITSEEA